MNIRIERISEDDRDWVRENLKKKWGSSRVVSRGIIHQADMLPGFIALWGDKPAGLLTYNIVDDACEIVSLDVDFEGQGLGSALLEAVREQAVSQKCNRIWLITTNDNTEALRFYQKRSYALVAVHRCAIEQSRKLKPSIPEIGYHGIPIRDEIELEYLLTEATEKNNLARQIYRIAHLEGAFRLRSGAISREYFDKYRFEADSKVLHQIALGMSELIPDNIDGLAGLELGGIPIVTMLAHVTGLPALFVRKKAKEYGTCQLAEGGEIAGQKLVIIEDVVTSGGQILLSTKELRALGAQIDCVLCVIDRESGGRENLAEEGLELRSLFTLSELQASAI